MAGKTHGEEMGMPVEPPVDEMMAMMGGEMPMPMEMPIAMLHDVVIHRIAKKGKTCIESIPPEEILVESNAKSIEDANFIAQKKMMTRGELIELGFERDISDRGSIIESLFGLKKKGVLYLGSVVLFNTLCNAAI